MCTLHGAYSDPWCLNWALRKTALDNQQQFNKMPLTQFWKDLYGRYLNSLDDSLTAIKTIPNVVTLLKFGDFHLAKFISNSCDILQEISCGNLSTKIVNLDLDELSIERTCRILGFQSRCYLSTLLTNISLKPKEVHSAWLVRHSSLGD